MPSPPTDLFASTNGWRVVATIPAAPGGRTVEIDEARMPARFYRVRALPAVDDDGAALAPFVLATGSGPEMGRLAAVIGAAIAKGMLTIEED